MIRLTEGREVVEDVDGAVRLAAVAVADGVLVMEGIAPAPAT